MKHHGISLVGCLLLFTAVAAGEPSLEAVMELRTESSTEETKPEPERPELMAFAFEGLGIDPQGTGDDLEEKLIQRFGEPNRIQYTSGGDRWGPTQTNFWHYDGLLIRTEQYVGASRVWIRTIKLTSAAYKLKFGLSIGAKRSQFLATLDPPNRTGSKSSGSLDYFVSRGLSGARVQILFDHEDRAEKIMWEYSTD